MSYDPTSGEMRDTVRLLIGDTDTSNEIFTDDEIDMIIARNPNDEFAAAGNLLLAIASSQARIAHLMRVGGRDFEVDRRNPAESLRKQAERFFALSKEYQFNATELEVTDDDVEYTDSFGGNVYDFNDNSDGDNI